MNVFHVIADMNVKIVSYIMFTFVRYTLYCKVECINSPALQTPNCILYIESITVIVLDKIDTL